MLIRAGTGACANGCLAALVGCTDLLCDGADLRNASPQDTCNGKLSGEVAQACTNEGVAAWQGSCGGLRFVFLSFPLQKKAWYCDGGGAIVGGEIWPDEIDDACGGHTTAGELPGEQCSEAEFVRGNRVCGSN